MNDSRVWSFRDFNPADYWAAECENCAERFWEPRDGVGRVRCPSCESVNVHRLDDE